ncbi:MAG: PIG-L family deacetylase [Chloroflexota bacterium]
MSDVKPRTLIFVGGHPDDETFGLGGTLARYAAAGVRVYYVCATRGELGSPDPENYPGEEAFANIRWAELECASQILGLSGVIHLGYRDSGMPGSAENRHPRALAAAPPEEVTGRIVRVIRELKPQVVITFDPIGGYRHPDHIAVHNATVQAFHAAGDAARYPEAGPAFQPQKLYFHIFPRGILKLAVKLLPLLGQDPHRFGRNKDVDLASLVEVDFPVHAALRHDKQLLARRDRAAACYVSQADTGPPRAGLLSFFFRFVRQRDNFTRVYPPGDKRRETDLFQGVV